MKFFAPLIFGFWLLPAFAQTNLATSGPVQIWTPTTKGESPIRLSRMDIRAKTYGFLASTRIELEFTNPNNRVLEGEFVFPLAPGQTISGYALEVKGVLREGVVVAKQTARVAFEEITRRGVDPGLAELTRGNVFRTRIYPIPAHGRKRIAITIEQALLKTDGRLRYRLPVPVTGKLERYSVRVEALAGDAADSSALRLTNAKIAERTQTNVQPEAIISLDLPANNANQIYAARASHEQATPQKNATNDTFDDVVAQLDAPNFPVGQRSLPKTIAIYLDASRSGLTHNHEKEQAFLAQLLAGFGDAKVQLIAFRDAVAPAQDFQLQAGKSAALFAAIKALAYDGGTALASLKFAENPDLAIVLTDGSSTFEPFKLNPTRPAAGKYVIAYGTATPDANGIARLAARLNASVIDLVTTTPDTAVNAALAGRLKLIATAASGACIDVIAISAIVANQATLAARCRAESQITLSWSDGLHTETHSITTPTKATLSGATAAPIQRLWAAVQIGALNVSAQHDTAKTLALATQFGVVTEQTSLLVLDSIDDYLRYDVMPVEPDLRAQFESRRALQISNITHAKPNLDGLISQWQEFKTWHSAPLPWLSAVLVDTASRNVNQWRELGNRAQEKQALAMLERAKKLELEGDLRGNEKAARLLFKQLLGLDTEYLNALSASAREKILQSRAQAQAHTGQTVESSTYAFSAEESSPVTGAPPPPASPMAQASAPEVMADSALAADRAPRNRADADFGSGDASTLSEVEVTGARIRRADEALSQPKTQLNNLQTTTATNTSARLELKPYTPNAPYLARIRAAQNPYAAYLSESDAEGSIGFYLDCADYFYSEGKDEKLALRVLSNISEVQVENVGAIRVLAEKLRQWQRWDVALAQFELAQTLRPEEPQGYRDFALALAHAPITNGGDQKRALTLLWHVASHDWDSRFNSIQLTALHEFNDLLARAAQAHQLNTVSLTKELGVPKALIGPVPVGLRVVLGWNANDVDIDLWVRDPAGEWAYYSQKQTNTGGQMSDDFTEGYGPETFTIARPLPGTYTVFAHYFANHEQKLAAPITVYLEFQTPFGAGAAKTTATVRRLEAGKEHIEIGRFTVDSQL
jgi:Ca-activated chloride channel homolog